MPFTHHHTRIRQWERNESILTSKSGVNSLEKKNKEQNKLDGGAHWHTEACKLFRSSFLSVTPLSPARALAYGGGGHCAMATPQT